MPTTKSKAQLYTELKKQLGYDGQYETIEIDKVCQLLANWFSSDELEEFIEYLEDEL